MGMAQWNSVGSSLCQTGTGAMASTGRSHEVLTTVPAQARVEQDYEQSQRYEGRELAGKRWSGTWPWRQGCLSCYGLCVLFLCLGQPEAQRRTCPDHECLLSSAAHLETSSTFSKSSHKKISDQSNTRLAVLMATALVMPWAWHSRHRVGSSLCLIGTGDLANTGRSHEVLNRFASTGQRRAGW